MTSSNIVVMQIDESSADFSWTAATGTNIVDYIVEWGPLGYTPGSAVSLGTDVSATTLYQVTGLTDANAYTFAVRTNCGVTDGNSIWITKNFGTTAIETFGNGMWHGYVYSAASNCSFTNYLGYVEESAPQFTRNVREGTWTGENPLWNGMAPINQFSVRYRMLYDFPCGNYTFTINGDDRVHLSVSIDPNTPNWIITGNWGTTTCCAAQTNSTPVYLRGLMYLIFEFYEDGGGANTSISWTTPALTVNAINTTTSTTEVTFGVGTEWNVLITQTPQADPTNPTNVVQAQITTSDNPYLISSLAPATAYYIYAQESCSGVWGYTQAVTVATCPAPTGLTVGTVTTTTAAISWDTDATATSGWIIEWGTQGFIPGAGQELGTAIETTNTYTN